MSNQPLYKYYEGKIPSHIEGETRDQQIERKNYHSKMSGIILKARARNERRHKEVKRTSKGEALQRAKLYSRDS